MSIQQYPGGIITQNPTAPAGPFQTGAAPGIWTIDEVTNFIKQGIWPTAGLSPNYIEDCFQTWLYTGTGAALTITNNIDLSTKGGLTWIKGRSGATGHRLTDTARGVTKSLESNSTAAEATESTGLTAFGTTGFTIGADADYNTSSATYASWTFREQAKFFDIVTWTGNGTTQNIPHSLGATPGCIIVKNISSANGWQTWHRGLTSGYRILLNSTAAQTNVAIANVFGNNSTYVAPTSTQFTVGDEGAVNQSGQTMVAYLFAHDAGGFGLTGTDNVISCGSFTSGASDTFVSLGYEPQFVLWKYANGTEDWRMFDNMRGVPTGGNDAQLKPNTSGSEDSSFQFINFNSTGFTYEIAGGNPSQTYIYIAIRRGPMAVPTTGTSVFAPVTGNFSSPYTVTTNFPVDLTISSRTAGATRAVNDRLRGGTTNSYAYLNTASTAAELTGTGAGLGFQSNTAVIDTNWQTGGDALWWNFRRAPSFFDEVCYTGTGTLGQTYSHNLGVAPELIILKCRAGGSYSWPVWNKDLAASGSNRVLALNLPQAFSTDNGAFNSTAPTASVFTVGNNFSSNGGTGYTYVAYLFATCAGVSKVGSYTGTGATQTIDCGFGAGGARFVLIKRTDVSADWWVWDSARGMVAGTDPRIDLNAGNPQTNANWVYTISTGFQIVTTDASVNASGGTYIFLAIA